MTHYARSTQDPKAEGGLFPLDSTHYEKLTLSTLADVSLWGLQGGTTLLGLVAVRPYTFTTGASSVVSPAFFSANYAAVPEPDTHPVVIPAVMLQSPKGDIYQLAVNDAGAPEVSPIT